MSEIKLRPCPFCGGAVWFNHNMDLEPDGIKCESCRYVLRYSRIRVMPGERFEVAMRKMADQWNGRSAWWKSLAERGADNESDKS